MTSIRRQLPDPLFIRQFETTCGWCEKILPDSVDFGGRATLKSSKDAPGFEGQILIFRSLNDGRRIPLRVVDRKGHGLEYRACSEECRGELQNAVRDFYASWGLEVRV